ncbi:MAG: M20/M25/M40 family metallo-hydrolase [Alphaproteobacteria bacterium]|nr:M20/M25/M40 family metallo-hydrolase [Alphaproteobacteria bacterium]
MSDPRAELLSWIEADKDRLVSFLSAFVRARSPNPPGDTRAAMAVLRDFLAQAGLASATHAAQEHLPNLVAHAEGGGRGRHLVYNGHVDVFPAADPGPGERDPWSGAVEGGRLYGRGVADMKAGTAASVIAFAYLARVRERLKGRVTLTCVSDEETGGKWGTKWLLETLGDEVLGTCCLNGEPSGVGTVRFAEKGTVRLAFQARTPGAHGGYPHISKSATKIMARLALALEGLETMRPDEPEHVRKILDDPRTQGALDAYLGKGAAQVSRQLTMNVGVLAGGLKVNVLPGDCRMEVDIRLPIGLAGETVRAEVERIRAGFPEVSMAVMEAHSYPSSFCDPAHEMVRLVQDNAEALSGLRPVPTPSLGGSDSRYWRWRNVPAYLYGPSPRTMGQRDENVEVSEFLHVVRVHTLCGYDYLTR